MKKLLLFLAIFIAITAKAQPGTSQSDPIIIGGGPQELTDQVPVGTETWYKWYSMHDRAIIDLKATQLGGAFTPVSAEVLVIDNAGSLIFTDTDSLDADSTLQILLTGMDMTYDIYIKVNSTECFDCDPTLSTTFNIILAASDCGLNYNDGTGAGYNCLHTKDGSGAVTNVCPITVCASVPVYFSDGLGTGSSAFAPYYLDITGITIGTTNFQTSPQLAINTTATSPTYNTSVIFPTPGTYHVHQVLPGSPSNYTCPSYFVVNVIPAPSAAVTISPACTNQPVCFTGPINDPAYDKFEFKVWDAGLTTVLAYSGVITGPLSGPPQFCTPGPLSAGTYNVTLDVYSSLYTNPPFGIQLGCETSSTTTFTVSAPPGPVTVSPTTVCIGENTSLTANSAGATSYTWSPGTGLSATTGATVTANLTSTTTYTVTATDAMGCSTPGTFTITAENCCANNCLPPPITFTDVTLVDVGGPGVISWTGLAYGNSYSSVSVQVPPGGTMPSGKYNIFGTLTINVPVSSSYPQTTFSGSDLNFGEAAGITQITPLYIDKSWLHGCDRMWKGILSQNYIKVTNSIIEDGYYGIGVGLNPSHPGIFVDNVLFNRNYVGIWAVVSVFNTSSPNNFRITGSVFTCKNYPFPTCYSTGPYSSSSIYNLPVNVTFTSVLPTLASIGPNKLINGSSTTMKGSTNPLIPVPVSSLRSNTGINLSGCVASTGTFLNIGSSSSNTAQNKAMRNYFNYLDIGVYNTESKITVINSAFQKFEKIPSNVTMGGIFHDNLPGSIKGETHIGDLYNIDKQCTFQDSDLGVNATGGGYLNISTNDFSSITDKSISITKWNSPIDIDQNPTGMVDVVNNTFASSQLDFYAYDNQSIRAVVQENESTGSFPLLTYNVNIQENASSNKYALYRIDRNEFTGKGTGVYLNSIVNANITDNEITIADNPNLPLSFRTAGIWNENSKDCLFGNNKIRSQGGNNQSNWKVSGIYSSLSLGNTYCSNDIAEVGNSVKFQGYCAPSYVYSNSFDKGLAGITLDLTGETGNIGVLSGNTWYSAENIFGSLTHATFSDGFSNFSNAKLYYTGTAPSPNTFTSGSTPFSATAVAPIPGGPLCPTATFRSLEDPAYTYDVTKDKGGKSYIQKFETYYLVKLSPRYTDYKTTEFMNECALSNIGTFYSADDQVNDYITTRDIKYFNKAQNLNTSIIPENNVESIRKEFNEIYYLHLGKDSVNFISRLPMLREIAQKCPYTDGGAVYQARALLSTFDNIQYFNECERSSNLTSPGQSEIGSEILVYPNPSAGELYINVGTEPVTAILYSLIGSKLGEFNLTPGENKLNFPEYADGQYLIKLYTNDQTLVKTVKLIINK